MIHQGVLPPTLKDQYTPPAQYEKNYIEFTKEGNYSTLFVDRQSEEESPKGNTFNTMLEERQYEILL